MKKSKRFRKEKETGFVRPGYVDLKVRIISVEDREELVGGYGSFFRQRLIAEGIDGEKVTIEAFNKDDFKGCENACIRFECRKRSDDNYRLTEGGKFALLKDLKKPIPNPGDPAEKEHSKVNYEVPEKNRKPSSSVVLHDLEHLLYSNLVGNVPDDQARIIAKNIVSLVAAISE